MNKKRWLAVAMAVVIFVISFAMPAFTPKTEDMNEMLGKVIPFSPFGGQSGIVENTLEPGKSGSRIVQLSLKGAITGGSGGISGGYNHSFMMSQLEMILKDRSIGGILFVVDTPGGGVFESAQIRDKLLQIKEERQIPIYVTMQSMAASGGYYVSAPADVIFATEETWTGSIGVIMQSYNLAGLFNKYGIEVNTLKSGENKDIGSSYRKWTTEEMAILQSLIDNAFDKFVKVVAEGRKMDEATVRKIADGRIYDADQALENGLIDKIGYAEDALKALREENDLQSSELFEYKLLSPLSFYETLLGAKARLAGGDPVLAQLSGLLDKYADNTPRLLYLYGGE